MLIENTTPPKEVKNRRVPKFVNMNDEEFEIKDHPEMFTNGNFLVIDTAPEELKKWRKSIKKDDHRTLSIDSPKCILDVFRVNYQILPAQCKIIENRHGYPIAIFDIGAINGANQQIGINAEAYLFFLKRGYAFAYNKRDKNQNLIMLKNDKIVGGIMPVSI